MLFPFFNKVKCDKHASYKGERKPMADCDTCRAIFDYNEKLKIKIKEYNETGIER